MSAPRMTDAAFRLHIEHAARLLAEHQLSREREEVLRMKLEKARTSLLRFMEWEARQRPLGNPDVYYVRVGEWCDVMRRPAEALAEIDAALSEAKP